MTEPSQADIDAAFRKIPRLPPEPSPRGRPNVICSQCWSIWLADDEPWQSKPVHVVTVHEGQALCEKHFRERKGLPPKSPAGG